MIREKITSIFYLFFLSIVLVSWSCRNKVTINRNYIYSTSWSKGEYQGFQIAKIKLTDGSISVFDENFDRYLLDKHVVDSSFCYGAGGNSSNTTKIDKMPKIYFDKESKYYIWYKCQDITETVKTIGLLELSSWYKISGIHGAEDFYVFIDKEGESHTYSLGLDNW